MSTGAEPTILARKALQRNNIVAEAREAVLLVWGCNEADRWTPEPSSSCHEHPQVRYWVSKSDPVGTLGHLDPHTQEIIKSSSLAPCRTHYLKKGDNLISVTNGSVTILNGTYPFLRLSPMSGDTLYNPPSWVRDTTEASNHKTQQLTYNDIGNYNPEEETLGSMIHHLHSRDSFYIFMLASVLLLWIFILAPIIKLRKDIRTLSSRQDGMLFALK